MVVGRDRNKLLCLFLSDDVLVQFLLDPVRGGNIINGKDRLVQPLFLFFHFGTGLSETAAVSEDVSQIKEPDGRSSLSLFFVLLLAGFIRILIPSGKDDFRCRPGKGVVLGRNADLDLNRDILFL